MSPSPPKGSRCAPAKRRAFVFDTPRSTSSWTTAGRWSPGNPHVCRSEEREDFTSPPVPASGRGYAGGHPAPALAAAGSGVLVVAGTRESRVNVLGLLARPSDRSGKGDQD